MSEEVLSLHHFWPLSHDLISSPLLRRTYCIRSVRWIWSPSTMSSLAKKIASALGHTPASSFSASSVRWGELEMLFFFSFLGLVGQKPPDSHSSPLLTLCPPSDDNRTIATHYGLSIGPNTSDNGVTLQWTQQPTLPILYPINQQILLISVLSSLSNKFPSFCLHHHHPRSSHHIPLRWSFKWCLHIHSGPLQAFSSVKPQW